MDYNLYQPEEEKPSRMPIDIPFRLASIIIFVLSVGTAWYVISETGDVKREIDQIEPVQVTVVNPPSQEEEVEVVEEEKEEWRFIPGPISMDLVKKNGCVADGFLSGYGGKEKETIAMINRSDCVYLHRALETWLGAPKFEEALEIMEKVEKNPIVYGMFIAEAISTRKKYKDPISDKTFRFEDMCREGTADRWGKETCIPSIQNVEYRRYLKAITRRAMDLGIQSFLFGQIQLQDSVCSYADGNMKKVLDDMREYSKERNMEIIIGAQTDDITEEKYLRMFDYIEGGVGINSQGIVENQPCSSKFGSCWALLWDKRYSSKANNVLLHLDWSGLTWDDMGIFARMPQERRISTLENLYKKFTSQNMGFMMPFLAVLSSKNDGCYGPNKNFYSPSNKYKCEDEDHINRIMPDVTAVVGSNQAHISPSKNN